MVRLITWKNIFKNALTSTKNLADRDEERLRLIENAFSDEFLSSISTKLKKCGSKEFVRVLNQEVKLSVSKATKDVQDCTKLTESFIQAVYTEIEEKYPTFSLLIYQELLYQDTKKGFDKIYQLLQSLHNQNNSVEEELAQTETLEQFNQKLINNTLYSFGLDFFDYEDEQLAKDLKEALKSKCIYLTGKSREESYLCIMQELRKLIALGEKLNPVLIIEDEKIWKSLFRKGLSGYILIPMFEASLISPIDNNTSILFVGSSINAENKTPLLEIRKRTKNNYIKKVNQAFVLPKGEDLSSFAYKSLSETKGYYSQIRRRYFKGDTSKPEWMNYNHSILKKLMLVNQWTEEDKFFFEQETKQSYESMQEAILELSIGSDPFLYKDEKDYSYKLVKVNEAWANLGYLVTEEEWKEYCGLIKELLSFHQEANDKPSLIHKKALIENLIISKDFLNNSKKTITHRLVKQILDSYASVESYAQFAGIAEVLVEYNPSMFINKIRNDLIRFGSEINQLDSSFQNIMFALEKALRLKDYAIECLELLFLINDLKNKYGLCVSPTESIAKALSAWGRHGALTKQKIEIEVKKMIAQYEDTAWDVIFTLWPQGGQGFICPITDLVYIELVSKDIEQSTTDTMRELYKFYIETCINNINGNVNRLFKILDCKNYTYWIQKTSLLEIINDFLNKPDDKTKKNIQDKLRRVIFINRHHSNADWTMSESVLSEIEDVYNSIIFDNKVYGFTYLIENNEYDFPMLNPESFGDTYNSQKEMDKISTFIINQLKEFKNLGLSILELIDCAIIPKENGFYSNMGKYITQVFSPDCFELELFSSLFNHSDKTKDFAFQYLNYCYIKLGLKDALTEAIKIVNDDNDLMLLSRIETIDKNADLLLFKLSPLAFSKFWETSHPASLSLNKDRDTICYVFEQYMKFNNMIACEWLIALHEDYFTSLEILGWLNNCLKNRQMKKTQIYWLRKICKNFINCPDMWEVLAKIELSFGDYHDYQIAPKWLATNPLAYASIINRVLNHKDNNGNEIDVEANNEFKINFSSFMGLLFCPGCIDDKIIDSQKFNDWINDFKQQLVKQNQGHWFDYLLGRLLVCSPKNEDGHELATVVREYIDNHYSTQLDSGYHETRSNKIGAFWCEEGKGAAMIADGFKKEYEYFDDKNPSLAKIYKRLEKDYLECSDYGRKMDEV